MKIAFTYYPAFVRYNHGVALLSSLCKEKGLKVIIAPIDDIFFARINDFNPDYICASFVTVHDYKLSLPFLRNCDYPILAGGVYLRKGGLVDTNLFKHICRGEAENIPYFFINENMAVFDEVQYCEDISSLPMPDYTYVIGDEFDRGYSFLVDKKIIPYSHGRGCPYKCNFCESQNLPQSVRIKTTVKKDLEYLSNAHKPDMFFFLDELLPYYNESWRKQFDGNEIKFFSYIRADILKSDLEFLIDNGLYACAFGIESGDEKYRNEVLNKNLFDYEIKRTISTLVKNNIHYVPFFMVGTPKETEDTYKKTLDMFKNIGGYPTIWEYEDLRRRLWDGQRQR